MIYWCRVEEGRGGLGHSASLRLPGRAVEVMVPDRCRPNRGVVTGPARVSSQFPGEMSIPENMIETGAVTPPSLDNQNTESASVPNPATAESPFTVTRSVKPATGKTVWVVTPKLYPSQAERSEMAPIAQELGGLWKTSDCGQIPGFQFINESDAHLFMSNSFHIASRRFRL